MDDRPRSSLDLGVLLAAVEAAPPIAAAEVFGAALAETLDVRDVSFLIADFSGRSLVRLSHVARDEADGGSNRERTETVPLEGTLQGRAMVEQHVEVIAENGGTRLYAPVSSRGEAVGPAADLSSWLATVGRDRRPVDLLGQHADDDIADPIGQPDAAYEQTAAVLAELVERLGRLLDPIGA